MSTIKYVDIIKNHTDAEVHAYLLDKVKNIQRSLSPNEGDPAPFEFKAGYAFSEIQNVRAMLEEYNKKYTGNGDSLVL